MTTQQRYAAADRLRFDAAIGQVNAALRKLDAVCYGTTKIRDGNLRRRALHIRHHLHAALEKDERRDAAQNALD